MEPPAAITDQREAYQLPARRAADSASVARRPGAELLVVDELDRAAVDAVAARRALRIAAQPELAEPRLDRVVDQQAAGQRLAQPEDQLDRLGRLQDAHDAGQDAEHPRLGARRRLLGGRRLRVQAAVARRAVRREHRDLAFEPEDRG